MFVPVVVVSYGLSMYELDRTTSPNEQTVVLVLVLVLLLEEGLSPRLKNMIDSKPSPLPDFNLVPSSAIRQPSPSRRYKT